MTLSEFVDRPLKVAQALAQGEAGGSIIESYLLVGSIIGGMAAFAWPGDGSDRRRFVEIWARFADPQLGANRISLPLLTAALSSDGQPGQRDAVEGLQPRRHLLGGLVVTGDDIDADESSVLRACPSLELSKIRRYSYGALYYKQVRSPVVHEYQLGDRATARPMTAREVGISYSNRIIPGSIRTNRLIHFHLPWLVDVVMSIARNLDDAGAGSTLPEPRQWWLFEQ